MPDYNRKFIKYLRNTCQSYLLVILAVISLPSFAGNEQAINSTDIKVDTNATPGLLHRDLEGIRQAGKLRVLFQGKSSGYAAITPTEKAMLERFSNENNLTLVWLQTENNWQLLPELMADKADIIIGQSKSLTAGMQGQALYTLPWVTSYQQVVARADTGKMKTIHDLAYRQVALKTGSPAWSAMEHLAKENPTMDLVIIPPRYSDEEIMRRVSNGEYDVTISDSDFLKQYLPKHPELAVAYDLEGEETRVWIVHHTAEDFREQINQFLNKNHLEFNISQIYLDDLPEIEERKLLRVITYNDPTNYFFSDGRFHGFEYELIRNFARDRNMRVDVVLAGSHEEMHKMLARGEGDLIAAALPVGSISGQDVRFTDSYNFSTPLLVGRKIEKPLLDVRDLNGRRIILPLESPYLAHLQDIKRQGIDIDIVINKQGMDTSTLLSRIAAGKHDLTVISSNIYNDELSEFHGLRAHFALSEPQPHGWVVRKENSQLLSALNEHIKSIYRGRFYNTLYTKYIERQDLHVADRLFASVDKLSPYDNLVRKYADKYSFDWRLIVAQMYQESRFDPLAISRAGAEGLMQIMPATAEGIGLKNSSDPAQSIEAGIKYLNQLRSQFENELQLTERTWFSLASYNAGYGRINSARKRAVEMGLNPNRWFGHVEKAMLALAKPYKKDGEYISNCRCGETVAYVQEIRALYNNYVRLTQAAQVAMKNEDRRPFGI